MNAALALEAVKQGGLLIVLLVLFYFYRRDFAKQDLRKDDTISTLINLVQQATTVMANAQAMAIRLTEAVESVEARMEKNAALAERMQRVIEQLEGRLEHRRSPR